MKLNEIFVKYGDETIYRPAMDDKSTFEYRGYKVTIDQDGGEFWIDYDPELPTKLETLHTCKNIRDFKKIATKAINLAHAMQVQASGQAASSDEVGAGFSSGPLRRANG